jgi:hypothetical protein
VRARLMTLMGLMTLMEEPDMAATCPARAGGATAPCQTAAMDPKRLQQKEKYAPF